MAKIGIDLNEVLRAFIEQLEYTYNKYEIGEKLDIKEHPVTDFNLIEHFPISGGIDALNKFMYEDAPLEIFGHADEMYENLINRLNLFNLTTTDDEEHELWIVSREALNSIPATLFFLCKTGCKVPNIKFFTKYEHFWDDFDVIITANPKIIEVKPENKIVIKIKSSYNSNIECEYEFETLFEIMDGDILNKI